MKIKQKPALRQVSVVDGLRLLLRSDATPMGGSEPTFDLAFSCVIEVAGALVPFASQEQLAARPRCAVGMTSKAEIATSEVHHLVTANTTCSGIQLDRETEEDNIVALRQRRDGTVAPSGTTSNNNVLDQLAEVARLFPNEATDIAGAIVHRVIPVAPDLFLELGNQLACFRRLAELARKNHHEAVNQCFDRVHFFPLFIEHDLTPIARSITC